MEPEKILELLYLYQANWLDTPEFEQLQDALQNSEEANTIIAKWIEFSLISKETTHTLSDVTSQSILDKILEERTVTDSSQEQSQFSIVQRYHVSDFVPLCTWPLNNLLCVASTSLLLTFIKNVISNYPFKDISSSQLTLNSKY